MSAPREVMDAADFFERPAGIRPISPRTPADALLAASASAAPGKALPERAWDLKGDLAARGRVASPAANAPADHLAGAELQISLPYVG